VRGEAHASRARPCSRSAKGNQPSLQRAVFDAVQEQGPRDPDHTELDRGHGKTVRRSIWVAAADDIDFPHARQAVRIRRDRYGTDGALIGKEIVHAVTSLPEDRASAADLARIARGQWSIESMHWLRDTAYAEDANTGYAPCRPSLATETVYSTTCHYEIQVSDDFGDPLG
jgi:hypothetical protein